MNLGLYYVDPAHPTEVKMVPAAASLPLCTTATDAGPTGLGQASGDLTLGPSGLPPDCWPNTWPVDGRDGGVPDPTTAGPAIIQIGTESGLLPSPVVIPSTPISFEFNRRSITVLNIGTHGLLLGPAERADVIIDFSQIPAGSTLILYNDAPAPVPAFDPRIDYYTGDPDQTSTGGAPTTLEGYGPNTRTIMQFRVGSAISVPVPFDFARLQSQLPAAYRASQPEAIIPEPTIGGGTATEAYSHIFDTQIASNGVTFNIVRKAIHELFETNYGRMNAILGVELPLTNFNTQTTIPFGYIDPPTESLSNGGTQIWKITHNGVDTPFHSLPPVRRAGDQPGRLGRHDQAARLQRAGLEGNRQDEPARGHHRGVAANDAGAALCGLADSVEQPPAGRDEPIGHDGPVLSRGPDQPASRHVERDDQLPVGVRLALPHSGP